MPKFNQFFPIVLVSAMLSGCVPQFGAEPTPVPPTLQVAPTRTPEAVAAAPSSPPESATAEAATSAPPTAEPTAQPTRVPVATLPPTPTLAPVARDQREEMFTTVWELVRDYYVYEDYRGVDWQAIKTEFEPQIAATEDPEQFYTLMRDMIERLGDDHSRFESPQEVAEQEAEYSGELRYGGIGAMVRTLDSGGLILTLAPEGPAAQAGLQERDMILMVEGVPFTATDTFGPDGPIGWIRGEPGTPVRLLIQTRNDPPREVTIIRQSIPSGAFPDVTAKRVGENGRIGLVQISTFYVEAIDTKTRDAIYQLVAEGPLDGLIIDVRGNSGGYVHLMRNTVALFADGGSIGTTGGRGGSEEQRIPSGEVIREIAEVPVIVLVDNETASAAEMFAAGMRVLGQASVMGVASAGNTENLYSYPFDDGSRLMLAQVAYRLPDGTLIEGTGVLPDQVVDVEWWRFHPDEDPQVGAAIDALIAQIDQNVVGATE